MPPRTSPRAWPVYVDQKEKDVSRKDQLSVQLSHAVTLNVHIDVQIQVKVKIKVTQVDQAQEYDQASHH